MKYTSLQHCAGINSQSDFSGTRESVLETFEKECSTRKVKWAYLCFAETGDIIASYEVPHGLRINSMNCAR